MQRILPTTFLNQLPIEQMVDFWHKFNAQMNEFVLPVMQREKGAVVEYNHFVDLPGLYVCAETLYRRLPSGLVNRKVKKIRVYESEVEMEFYMALEEYENDLSDMTTAEKFIFN